MYHFIVDGLNGSTRRLLQRFTYTGPNGASAPLPTLRFIEPGAALDALLAVFDTGEGRAFFRSYTACICRIWGGKTRKPVESPIPYAYVTASGEKVPAWKPSVEGVKSDPERRERYKGRLTYVPHVPEGRPVVSLEVKPLPHYTPSKSTVREAVRLEKKARNERELREAEDKALARKKADTPSPEPDLIVIDECQNMTAEAWEAARKHHAERTNNPSSTPE